MINNFLENIANFATFIGLLAVAYQIYLSKQEQRIQHEKQEKQKAIELAELYADKILDNVSYLCEIFESIGVYKYFKDIKYNQLKEFDKYELEQIFPHDDIQEIERIMKNIDTRILVDVGLNWKTDLDEKALKKSIEALQVLKISEKEIAATIEKREKEKEYSEEELNRLKALQFKHGYYTLYFRKMYNDIMNETLNTLEYFCMYLNTKIADEDTIYQSLHQSFLSVIKVVYFRIASRNITGKDKYYTNIIELYNRWSDKYHEREQEEIKNNRGTVSKPQEIRR